uniref:Uncharacterized protein n=1 Tax=Meloidogyne enterolobii TaxID=390850 RepID=A0A6V7XY61_MELEN|nr:unnamed protein product [Meloidogyne enterolobii]
MIVFKNKFIFKIKVKEFLGFPDDLIITKYSFIRKGLNLSEAELWQKQNNLNLKYINLTKMDIWRENNLTKFLLIEIPKDWNGECGGFANQMWRFAVIYVWGLQLGRYPGIFNNSAWTCDSLNLPNEIEETFPVVHKIFIYFKPNQIENNTKYQINYDLNEMIKSKEKYLRILPPPQIHELFKNYRNQVRELFTFSNKVRTIVDKYINEIFRNDSSHKLCVHTRLGDFGTIKWPKHHPSRKDFTEESTKFVFNEIKVQKRVFIPKNMPRGQDIYFSTKICNSLIITASVSTFGWWIGYLLNDIKSQIYFYDDFDDNTIFQRKDFPSEWIPLKFNLKTKQIIKEGH